MLPVRTAVLGPLAALSLAASACGTSSTGATTGGDSGVTVDAGFDATSDAASDSPSPTDAGSGADSSDAKPATDAHGGTDAPAGEAGAGCGYQGKGTAVHVAANLDVCLPPVVCTSETCPPPLGSCVGGKCVFDSGYSGIQTLPEAWVTYYCQLSTGGCNGVTQIDPPYTTAQTIASQLGVPLCEGDTATSGTCVGIAASSAMVVGNSQVATDPSTGKYVTDWGLGLTEASGLCYALTGPGGSAVVALTDRCGGYCKCNGSGYQECGPCVSAPDMAPNCPCVGAAPPLFTQCCGTGCGGTVVPACDWCASNNHPHFDLDQATFNRVCGAQATQGSCKLSSVGFVPCLGAKAWPP